MKVEAKQRFGQHFLKDTGVLHRIARHLNPSRDDIFLEIGAGKGALSEMLAGSVLGLIALEIDADCLAPLKARLEPYPAAVVELGDILTLDLEELVRPHIPTGAGLRVVGNLPYNIATAIIERILFSELPVRDMTFLVQLEMAQRITAVPGTRAYGYYSVLCQHRASTTMGLRVAPGSFSPPPKVKSALVSLEPRTPRASREFEKVLICLVKASFGHRRKMILNSLRQSTLSHLDWDVLLERAGIDGRRRAEEISVVEYEKIATLCSDSLLRNPRNIR